MCCSTLRSLAPRSNPNYEEPGQIPFWTLVINATDNGYPPEWVSFRINIELINLNDLPAWHNPPVVYVPESTPVGGVAFASNVTDDDLSTCRDIITPRGEIEFVPLLVARFQSQSVSHVFG